LSAKPHIVFYDDSCPLCDAEIEHYKKLKTVHAISWLGIDASWDDIKQHGFSKQTLLKRIHAIHSDGTIVTGAAAFALIWNSLKYYRVLGFIVTKFKLISILDFFYKYFAEWRYKKNKVCNIKQ
jgi:predicted DCC family thiol-disulfide oxidoreductase YuxK|tara:strand:- start:1242 stop:1613 length:372 start_codon:yes stop_codon:yes gene_type:complete